MTRMAYSRTIHFSDTDAAGVVYFASLLSICHEAYEHSIAAAGIDLKTFFRNTERALPIVHASVDFYHPLVCGDRLQINLTPTQLNETAFEITYELLKSSDLCVAKAITRHVCIDPLKRQRIPLSPSIRQWLQMMPSG